MLPFVQVVDGKLYCVRENHNQVINMVAMETDLPQSERLLCEQCFDSKQQVTKYLNFKQAAQMIQERLHSQGSALERNKQIYLTGLNEFKNRMNNLRSKLIQQSDEILAIIDLWITDISQVSKKFDLNNFSQYLKLLDNKNSSTEKNEYLEQSNRCHYQKIFQQFKRFIAIEDYKKCFETFQQMSHKSWFGDKQPQQFDLTIKETSFTNQSNHCGAIAFNDSCMVSGCDKDIKIWKFDQGQLNEVKTLEGHSNLVTCLVFSKKHNWFASGSADFTIRSWKDQDSNNWVSSQPEQVHTNQVFHLLLNNSENEMISCSFDKSIQVWRINTSYNILEHDYSLENRHSMWVYSITMNQSETALVSSSGDKKVILWVQNKNYKWVYKSYITMDDYAFRVGFFTDNLISWVQQGHSVVHVLEVNKGNLSKKSQLNLQPDSFDSHGLFPIIVNQKQQIIVVKHNRYVFILKDQGEGKLRVVANPIDCVNTVSFGALTEDGKFLVIWNDVAKGFKSYKINYD